MMSCCGKLIVMRPELTFNFLELFTRARAFDASAAVMHQMIRIEAVVPVWLFG